MGKEQLNQLVNAFNRCVVEACNGKSVLLTLSGGLDTRAILSVLSRFNIECDALTHCAAGEGNKDYYVAKKLVKKVDCIREHIFLEVYSQSELRKIYKNIFPKYGVVLHGVWMSGIFDKFEHIELSEKALSERIDTGFRDISEYKNNWENMFFPVEDKMVQDVLSNLPIMYRYFHYPQRFIILKNDSSLMNVGFTTFNLRNRFFRLLHWNLMDLADFLKIKIG